MDDYFGKSKLTCLAKIDSSRKGSIDDYIRVMVEYINSQDHYFTTSSCSGRIIIFEDSDQKKNCKWLYTSHIKVKYADLDEPIQMAQGNATFKFEAFIMHIQCCSLRDAQLLHTAAIASGFRNSGISVGSKGKIITAIRSTHSLEIPLTKDGRLMVSSEYIKFIVELANAKLQQNFERIDRLLINIKGIDHSKTMESTGKRKHKEHTSENVHSSIEHSDNKTDLHDDKEKHIDCSDVENHSEENEDIFNGYLFDSIT